MSNLVEAQIKYIMNHQLENINKNNQYYQNLKFNIILFTLFCIILSITLYIKYKGQQDINTRIQKENMKRDYILSNLRKYQNLKNQYLTNIPL
jgi:hypothetical protein|tara:strand:- start:3661 stop:3939 length:279 start_codon:yes stop_codon:yes gene_type:complete